jgi:hypothetical protein
MRRGLATDPATCPGGDPAHIARPHGRDDPRSPPCLCYAAPQGIPTQPAFANLPLQSIECLPSSGYPQSHSGVERALIDAIKLRGEAIDLGLIGIKLGGFGFSFGFNGLCYLGELPHHAALGGRPWRASNVVHHGAAPAKRRSIKA